MKKKTPDENRRNFLKKSVAGLAGVTFLPSILKSRMDTDGKQTDDRKIITRVLGNTGLEIPLISMGVMNADNPNLVSAALDAGIIHLDTAHTYQRGRNEKMIGQVIKNRPRDSYILATKVEGAPLDMKTFMYTKEAKSEPFLKKFDMSLKRLGLDYVDIFYLHSVLKREAALYEEFLTAMEKLKKEGKIRFIGVSTHRNEPEVIQAAVESKVYDVVLTAYNFRQQHLGEMNKAIDLAAKAGLGVIAMKTQAGVYWDKEKQNKINMKAALKWALQNDNVHTVIPGFTTFDQMMLDLTVMEDLTLTPEEKTDLEQGARFGMRGMYCQQCGKCVHECSENLDIPTFMRSYMYAFGYKNFLEAKETMSKTGLSSLPCDDCSSCNVSCSLGFNVKSRVVELAKIQDIPEEFLS